ncbi:hypothetical protein GCM10010172_04770 [Paractinoplanes ferrugineus]|uniref:DUF4832 domain-containing protein n=1 Tax=Paractinoplanes ferrugineus TaxID=113564 RepID=A0A919J8Q0_9ACTN|nr:DUF4832 domain-containing protein [Actinoplanes ferrugineus]GIE12606.1 hypothetical protein Afe05nite_44460 [Actinoplanes ferrugineus]
MRLFAAAAAALVLLTPGVADAATPSSATVRYAGSPALIANPERGFFTYTETHLGAGYVPLTAASIEPGRTVVYRIFYLEKYADTDTITAADLALVGADFAAARRAGVKLVIRFAYSATDDKDAPVARVLGHLAQLKPLLVGNADVLLAVQAGFIGTWGEWYYSRNFPRTDTAARQRVLDALLAATAADTPIQVRTPGYKRALVPDVARVGVHDDCFLAGTDDYGTFEAPDDRSWLAAQSFLVGGETCAPSARSGWADAAAEMARYHWTYLNPSFNADVLDSWGEAGRAEAGRRLGYRLRLTAATLPTRAKRGAAVTARITITNDGYAAPVRNRPVRLLVGGTAVTVDADVRSFRPGRPVTLTVTFRAPSRAGTYPLSLALPDPLLSAAPYAVQLANTGVWDAATGRNRLGVKLTTA